VPEGLEAEIWRRASEPLIGRTIVDVVADDRVVSEGFGPAVIDATFAATRRRGKVVLLDTDGPTIGLHFAMTGRLVIDDDAAIGRLAYASGRDDAAWDRLVLFATPGGRRAAPALRFNDPRRLGRVSLDADLDHLGLDIFAVTPRRLAAALSGRRGVIKSTLLDQHVIAGLGNLLADEVLWWSGIDPRRTADSLSPPEVERLAKMIRRRLPIMLARGGSTTGVLSPPVRASRPPCERDGTPLVRIAIGGRSTVWCPGHQH
jgi:formamidopyrimidine-DNA glycosylase